MLYKRKTVPNKCLLQIFEDNFKHSMSVMKELKQKQNNIQYTTRTFNAKNKNSQTDWPKAKEIMHLLAFVCWAEHSMKRFNIEYANFIICRKENSRKNIQVRTAYIKLD